MKTDQSQSERFRGDHSELTEKIIGIFFAVANELGSGFLESVSRRSMLIALHEQGFQAQEEVAVPVFFHGKPVGMFYADLVIEGMVILELKTAEEITKTFAA